MQYTVRETVAIVMRERYAMLFRLAKVIELSQDELELLKREKTTYIFWGWIDRARKKPDFVFGQFYLEDDSVVWGYKKMKFADWAKKAYRKDWFSREDVRESKFAEKV